MSTSTTSPTDSEIAAAIRVLARVLAPAMEAAPDDLLPLATAARVAATSTRVLRDAVRAGELAAYGNQRDRAVRRSDLQRWIDSRKVTHKAVDDADLDRRVRRLALVRGGR